MTTFERRQRLMTILREQPGIRVPEGAELLGVSERTIRNDLTSLAGLGLVRRVRGGVLLDEQQDSIPIFATRVMTHCIAKQSITQQAASLVNDNDSVMLDSSTTLYYLACCLKECRDLTVITNGIESARELAKTPPNTVILPGGISCSGFTPKGGLTEVDIYEAQIKRKMIASSGGTVALIDASKFGRMDVTVFARTDQITHLFTNRGLSPERVEKLKQTGVPFTMCGAKTEPA